MGTRDFDNDATHRRHGSHRRPHGADKTRTDGPHEEPTNSRRGSLSTPQRDIGRGTSDYDDELTNASSGMGDFLDSLEGLNIGPCHESTGGRLDNSKNGVWHEGGIHPREEQRQKRREHEEHGHKETGPGEHRRKEHRHKEPDPGEHRHREPGHKEPGHGEHRHREPDHGEHRHKEHRHGELHHKEHRHGEHRHGNHRHEEHDIGCRMTEGELTGKQKLYESALLPFHEKSGSRYPCKQSEIDFHHNFVFAKPNKGPFVSAMQATQEVMRWNDEKRAPPWEELDIIRRLTIAVHDAEKNRLFSPDLLIKTFADLDRIFFEGRLRGHVVVRWVDTIVKKRHTTLGHTVFHHRQPGQCSIEMNAEAILLQKWSHRDAKKSVATMFGVLLHEMCHAYAFVRCPYEKRDGPDGHGEHFQTKIGVIHDRAIRILGTLAIFDWQPYKQQHFLPKEGEKGRKEGTRVRIDDGKRPGGTGTGMEGQGRGTRKGTGCVVM